MFRYTCSACRKEIQLRDPWRKDFPVICDPCRKASEAPAPSQAAPPPPSPPPTNPRKLSAGTREDLVAFVAEEIATAPCERSSARSCQDDHPEAVSLWCRICRAREIVRVAKEEDDGARSAGQDDRPAGVASANAEDPASEETSR